MVSGRRHANSAVADGFRLQPESGRDLLLTWVLGNEHVDQYGKGQKMILFGLLAKLRNDFGSHGRLRVLACSF